MKPKSPLPKSAPGDKRFFPSKAKKPGVEQWIPELKALAPKKPSFKVRTNPSSKAGPLHGAPSEKGGNKSGSKKDLICLQCRKTGHTMRRCPENKGKGAGKNAKTLCYNCGSAEHSVHDCKAPPSEGGAAFRFASCFVCGEKGHISRECPQNAKGIYVKGGCCKLCQGVDHLIKDCPRLDESRRARVAANQAAGGARAKAPVEARKHTTFGGEDLDDDFADHLSDHESDGGGGGASDDEQPAVSAAKQYVHRDGKGKGKGTKAAKSKVVTF